MRCLPRIRTGIADSAVLQRRREPDNLGCPAVENSPPPFPGQPGQSRGRPIPGGTVRCRPGRRSLGNRSQSTHDVERSGTVGLPEQDPHWRSAESCPVPEDLLSVWPRGPTDPSTLGSTSRSLTDRSFARGTPPPVDSNRTQPPPLVRLRTTHTFQKIVDRKLRKAKNCHF